jgi:hypothetical protein
MSHSLSNPINLFKIPIPSSMKLLNRDFNPVYITNLDEINYRFYKECYPKTFDYMNSLKTLDFLTKQKKDKKKLKMLLKSCIKCL